jgi:sodium/hydrogen exchanger 8
MVQHLGCKAALACLCGARLLMQYHVETAAAVESSLVLIPLLGEMDDPTTDDTNSSNISIPAEFVDCEPEETPQTEFVIVLGLFCVAITFTLSYFAERRHMDWLPEASIGVLVGAFASAIVALTRPDFSIVKHMQFSESFFFQFLLPPIIFEAGYNMKRQAFFKNFGGIMLYAFVGTFLSTAVVGLGVYGVGQIAGGAVSHPIGFLASLVFGSLISATDPVTVLAVFQSAHADLNLYSLVFGESVLNDAVAIVLYRTLVSFRTEPASFGSLMGAMGLFAGIFIGSTVIGVALGLMSALFFKHMMWHERQFLFQEVVLAVVFPWMSYYFAEGLELSGIVAILFCGIVMAQYTYSNLSDHDKDAIPGDKEGRGAKFLTRHMFKAIALFAETFVFVYLGFSMFAFPVFRSEVWSMIIVSLIFCFAGRALNVFPLSHLLNRYRKRK